MGKLYLVNINDVSDFINEADSSNSFIHSKKEPDFKVGKFIQDMVNDEIMEVFGLKSNENYKGFITLIDEDNGVFAIGPMYIGKDYRGQGLGTKQVELMIQEAKNRGIKKLIMRTWSTNYASINIFKGFGFEEFTRIENDREDGSDTVFMELKLINS